MSVTRGQYDARPTFTFPATRHHRPLAATKLYCLLYVVYAPTAWNSLPVDIRACTFYGSFTRQLKNLLF